MFFKVTGWIFAIALGVGGAHAQGPGVLRKPAVPVVPSLSVEVHYRVAPASLELSRVELWFTTDQGRTWWNYGLDKDCTPPVMFRAPREGLYGFFVVAVNEAGPSSSPPRPGTVPQTQCLVDMTPPVVQLHEVVKLSDFQRSRQVRIRWSSYDANMADRAVSLYYQMRGGDLWKEIVSGIADAKAYDWRMPDSIGGPLSIKLAVRDKAGNLTERTWTGVLGRSPFDVSTRPTSQPVAPKVTAAVATQPVIEPPTGSDAQRARILYERASWHIVRGELDVAAERLQEALALDQTLLDARTDLAAVAYAKGDMERALQEYARVLAVMPSQPEALRGSAMTYMAQHQHSQARSSLQRLLLVEPGNPQVWLDMGDVAYKMGQSTQAYDAWRKAIAADPSKKELIKQAKRRLEAFGVKP